MDTGPVSGWARRLAVIATALVASVLLAACGSDLGGGGSDEEVTTAEATGEVGGDLVISQWPFYIDRKTVPEFEEEAGVKVRYIEDVNDNNEIFAKLRPDLQNGESADRSIIVVSDWMAKKMYDLGYLQNLDKEAIPTAYENLLGSLETTAIDPDRSYTMPWQSGLTGLVVNTKEAPDVTSINAIFDPKYKGKVTVLTELRDTIPMILLGEGIDPAEATTQDWLDAIDKLDGAVKSGQIRKLTGNDYTDDIARGDAVIALGWSGDAIQLQADNPDIEFVKPEDGCLLWSDNMVIPVGAPNPDAAYAFMNYVYEPENQAQIAAYNNYITPVEGVQEIFEREEPSLADSELIFPDDQFTGDCSTIDNPPEDGVDEVEDAWQQLISGG
ncbi:MAG TPA: spermidine/putrescine ABC transporter substrate-binding protein [Solirubrobacterales bacterium]|nr:spermidine/putrescine ABC transporter substrate-binding protein [Solirubrobacterales bacterium]